MARRRGHRLVVHRDPATGLIDYVDAIDFEDLGEVSATPEARLAAYDFAAGGEAGSVLEMPGGPANLGVDGREALARGPVAPAAVEAAGGLDLPGSAVAGAAPLPVALPPLRRAGIAGASREEGAVPALRTDPRVESINREIEAEIARSAARVTAVPVRPEPVRQRVDAHSSLEAVDLEVDSLTDRLSGKSEVDSILDRLNGGSIH